MDEQRRDDLIAGFLAGTSSEDDDRELQSLASDSGDVRADLARHRAVDALIRQSYRPPVGGARVVAALPTGSASAGVMRRIGSPAPKGARRRRPWLIPAVGGAVAVAAGLLLIPWRAPVVRIAQQGLPVSPVAARNAEVPSPAVGLPAGPEPRRSGATAAIQDVVGLAQVIRGGQSLVARVGLLLLPGDRVETGADGEVHASLGSDARVRVYPDTAVAWPVPSGMPEAPALGTLNLQVTRGFLGLEAVGRLNGRVLGISAGQTQITADRARFTLSISGSSSRVDVMAGRVQVAAGANARPVSVEARHFAQITEGSNPVVDKRPPEILFLVGMNVGPANRLMVARLESLGFIVTVRREATSADDLSDKDLVFISASVDSPFVPRILRDARIPIVVCDPWVVDDLGVSTTDDGHNDFVSDQRSLVVNARTVPLAAGLADEVVVTSAPAPLGFAMPAPRALVAASVVGRQEDGATIFAYEQGAEMSGTTAPARRVAFLVSEQAVETLTPAGWALFDAAVKWAAASVKP